MFACEHWYFTCLLACRETPFLVFVAGVLVANKVDLRESGRAVVDEKEGRALAKSLGLEYFETSAVSVCLDVFVDAVSTPSTVPFLPSAFDASLRRKLTELTQYGSLASLGRRHRSNPRVATPVHVSRISSFSTRMPLAAISSYVCVPLTPSALCLSTQETNVAIDAPFLFLADHFNRRYEEHVGKISSGVY